MSSSEPEPLTRRDFCFLTSIVPDLPGPTIDETPTFKASSPLDYGRHESKKIEILPGSTSDLFRIIPTEIIVKILSMLDLQSLTDLRRVSWGVRAIVNTIPAYKDLMKYSPDTVRALLSTETAIYSTPQDILDELCRQDCFICGDFGPLLDTITGRRCCVDCATFSQLMRSIEISSAELRGLNETTIRKLRTVHTLRTERYRVQPRQQLVRFVEAKKVAVELGKARGFNFVECFTLSTSDHLRRFLPLLRFPTLDKRSGRLGWGVSCKACDRSLRILSHRKEEPKLNVHYTVSGYIEHFKHCKDSQLNRDNAKLFAEIKAATEDIVSRLQRLTGGLQRLTREL